MGGNLPKNMSLPRKVPSPNLESLDFFPVPKHLAAILDRDAQRYIYGLRALVPIDSGKEQSS